DLAVDDRMVNCLEIISASNAKAVLIARGASDERVRNAAESRGIGLVTTLSESLDTIERLEQLMSTRRGHLVRLSDWFLPKKDQTTLPHDPRQRHGSP
ncbi:MAG: hypothetical protein ACRD15_13285, partial [Vicinamibacterales bacterium]